MIQEPSYLALFESGELKHIASELERRLESCTLCPHNCSVDRIGTGRGRCRSGALPRVASWNPHFGEENPLVGRRGSGTVFFSGCNLSCVFCQNFELSHIDIGSEIGFERLSRIMLALQGEGCHNINFVTPTHMVFAIVRSLIDAVKQGLHIPLVYNSGGYDSVEILEMVDGVFDIYMPDFKYGTAESGSKYSGITDYPQTAEASIREMHRQVGDLVLDHRGIASRGVLVRHLVLPNDEAASTRVVDTIAEISEETYLNIMDQYRPAYQAVRHNDIGRRTTIDEVDEVKRYARSKGLSRLYHD